MLFQIFCKAAKVFQQAPNEFALNMDMPEKFDSLFTSWESIGLTYMVISIDLSLMIEAIAHGRD